MQLKISASTLLLLLPALATAVQRHSFVELSKRDFSALTNEPLYLAQKPPSVIAQRDVLKRQTGTCPTGTFQCTSYDMCCYTDTVCGVYGGEQGCCPKGKNCTGVSACPLDTVDCLTYCCGKGSTCGKDASGKGICKSGSGADTCGGASGYFACDNFQGCCPTGTTCTLPDKCSYKCTATDPICGNSCCPKGFVCMNGSSCTPEGDVFTSLTKSGSSTKTGTSSTKPINTLTRTGSTTTTSTGDLGANTDDADATTTTMATGTRNASTTTRTTVTTQSMSTAAANHFGLDSGLAGVVVGLLGYLAI